VVINTNRKEQYLKLLVFSYKCVNGSSSIQSLINAARGNEIFIGCLNAE
jgi:hypothetical protein